MSTTLLPLEAQSIHDKACMGEFAKHFAAFVKTNDLMRAFTECSDKVQHGVLEMIEVFTSPESDDQDRDMALNTLVEALMPRRSEVDGDFGHDLEACDKVVSATSQEARKVVEELDAEENIFAQNLERLMLKKNISQVALAEKIGVGQPAIANMLSRNCRPQRRTILRAAGALGVNPAELWPGFSAN